MDGFIIGRSEAKTKAERTWNTHSLLPADGDQRWKNCERRAENVRTRRPPAPLSHFGDGSALGFASLGRLCRQPSLALAGVLPLAGVARALTGALALAGIDSRTVDGGRLLGESRPDDSAAHGEADSSDGKRGAGHDIGFHSDLPTSSLVR
jgi:hypothetical protein